jgi:hypothetical protein
MYVIEERNAARSAGTSRMVSGNAECIEVKQHQKKQTRLKGERPLRAGRRRFAAADAEEPSG